MYGSAIIDGLIHTDSEGQDRCDQVAELQAFNTTHFIVFCLFRSSATASNGTSMAASFSSSKTSTSAFAWPEKWTISYCSRSNCHR